jgi:hypothetical protein
MHRVHVLGFCLLALLGSTLDATAQAPVSTPRPATRVAPPHAATPRVFLGTSESVFTTIQGNALDAHNEPLPESVVRLRDARYGKIVGTQVTDKAGMFTFRAIDPGTYIAELVAADRTVLAASELINVEAGQVMSAIVQLPMRNPGLGGFLSHTMQQLAAVTAAAAASGVMTQSVTGQDASAR